MHMSDSGKGVARAEDAQGTTTQSHIPPSIQVYKDRHILVDEDNKDKHILVDEDIQR